MHVLGHVIVVLQPTATSEASSQNKPAQEAASKLVSVKDYETYASTHMAPDVWTVVRQGATAQTTLHDNQQAFQRYRLMPRHLVAVTGFNSSTTVLGERVSMPIGVAPMAWQGWVHPEGDNASALAAQSLDTLHILSVYPSVSIEAVAEAATHGLRWQQLFLFDNRVSGLFLWILWSFSF